MSLLLTSHPTKHRFVRIILLFTTYISKSNAMDINGGSTSRRRAVGSADMYRHVPKEMTEVRSVSRGGESTICRPSHPVVGYDNDAFYF